MAAAVYAPEAPEDGQAPRADHIQDSRELAVPELKEFWADSDTVADLCQTLIRKFPKRFGHISAEEVGYYWRRHGGRSKRRDRFYGVQIVADSSFLMHRCRQKIVIWLAADHVKGKQLSERQAEALCFRALSQIGKDAKGRPIVQDFDFHGFRAELQEYGHWNDELQQIANIQLGLGFDEREDDPPATTDAEQGEPD